MSVRRRTVLAAAAAVLGITATTAAPGLTAGEEVTISFLTHWAPETVELLETSATAYSEEHPEVTVEIQAVPFGDLLTTVRAQAGGGDAPTIAGIYDLWLPELAPSASLLSWGRASPLTDARWRTFARRYRSEMRRPSAQRLVALLAALSARQNMSVGCYCGDESRCHRSVLKELLRDAGAALEAS